MTHSFFTSPARKIARCEESLMAGLSNERADLRVDLLRPLNQLLLLGKKDNGPGKLSAGEIRPRNRWLLPENRCSSS
jgi:hypothetical protein